jgi:hypothetical protein
MYSNFFFINSKNNTHHYWSNHFFLFKLLDSSLIYKLFSLKNRSNYLSFNFIYKFIYNSTIRSDFYNQAPLTNIFTLNSLNLSFKKHFSHAVANYKLNSSLSFWFNHTLIRFFENVSGRKVVIQLFPFINLILNYQELMRCLMWSHRVIHFKKVIGTGFFLNESVQIIYVSLKLKDPHFLINWLRQTLQKISFWKLKTFFYYLRYLFRYFFSIIFPELNIKGIKFRMRGKISVAGNARTRTVVHSIGCTSQTSLDNRIVQVDDIIRTFTGVIGLRIWLIF